MSPWLFLFFYFPFASAFDELPEIQVRAQKEVKDFSFSSVYEFSTAEIEKKNSSLLSTKLESINGIVSIQAGGPGGTTSYSIRGTESRHVAFTLDGLKLNDPSGPVRAFDAAFFTSPMLTSIQVYKGPQAVLFGSDAFGGLVDMKTRKGENAKETRLNLMGGSFGTLQASLGQDWSDKENNGTLTWSGFCTNGISRLNKKRFNANERDGADISQLSSSSRHRWAKRIDTDLLFSYLNGNSELDSAHEDNSKDHSRSDQYIAQQKTNYEINKESSISLRNGLSRHQRFVYTSSPHQAFDGDLIQNEAIYRKQVQRLSLLAGAANEHEDFKTGELSKNLFLNSLFLQSSYKVSHFAFQAGGRADHHSKYKDFLSGSAGISYEKSKNIFSLQYSQGFKAPTLSQLYAPSIPDTGWGAYAGGNPNLTPERNHSWEGKWIRSNKKIDTEIALFQNRLSNLINYGQYTGFKNSGKLITEGIEVNIKWKEKFFKITPSYTYQNFKANTSAVLRRPHNLAQVNLSINPTESSEYFLNYRWFSARKDLDPNEDVVKLNEYEVIDVGYRFIQEKFDLSFQILNILNREYEEIFGFSVMPRSVFVGLGLRFY